MIQKISRLLSVFTANNLHISEKDERIMQYCFEQILSKVLFFFLILIFGIFTHRFVISVLYLTSFALLRTFGGGAHAKNRLLCAVLSYGISLLAILFIPYLCLILPTNVFIFVYSVFIIYSLFRVPVDTKNKRIHEKKREQMRVKFLLSSLLLTIFYCLFYFTEYTTAYGILSICAMIFGISLIIGELQNRKEKVNAIQNCCLR